MIPGLPATLNAKDPSFDSVPVDMTLALLHLNHQSLAEAAPTVYGRRKFRFGLNQLMQFVKGIAFCGHLIKVIEVLEIPPLGLRFSPQTFHLVQNLQGLRSFAMRINTEFFNQVPEHVVDVGIY